MAYICGLVANVADHVTSIGEQMTSRPRIRMRLRTLVACTAATSLALTVWASPASADTVVLSDNGNEWDVQDSTGDDDGGINDGSDDAFDDWGMIRVVVADDGGVLVDSQMELEGFGLTYDATTRTFNTTTPIVIDDGANDLLEVSRTLWIPEGTDYVRYVDDFTNLTGETLTVTTFWGGDLGSDSSTEVASTSTGDKDLTAADTWAVTREGDADVTTDEPAGDPPVGYALGSIGNGTQDDPVIFYSDPVAPWPNEGEDGLGHSYTVEVEAGETFSLAYFLYRGLEEDTTTEGDEVALAEQTVALLRDAPNFSGLTTEQVARIANWDAPTFTATPDAGPAGSSIEVAGTLCGSTDEGDYDVVVTVSPTGGGDPVTTATFASSATGAWSGTVVIPEDTRAGTYTVSAVCRLDDAPRFPYASDSFEVQPGILAGGALTISPTSGPSGTVITVTGTACEADTVDLGLGASTGESGGVVAETNDVPVNDDGSFSGTLTVPAGSDPDATYSVGATCGTDNYALQAFDVTPSAGMTGANGYRMVAADGGIFTFGDRMFHGSTGSLVLNKPIVGGATDISDYDGYWIVASDGGVFTFNAEFHGSLGGQALPAPAVEIEPTPTGKGYWIVLANGKVYTFGDANFFGDISGTPLNKPVIGMSVTPSGQGYWLVAEDGGIFNYGDAEFFGSMGDQKLNAPVIDLAPAVDNNGYYLLGRDGGVFTFGSAEFKGSTGSMTLNAPVVAMLVIPTGAGYWLAASDGGIFTFGAGAEFLGSMGGTKLNSPVLDLIN